VTRFACVVPVDGRGWVLLQERDEHPRIAPEKWGMCGGHLEHGESFLDGAVRELEEETGLALEPADFREIGEYDIFHPETDSLDRCGAYAVRVDATDDDIVLGEGRRIVFVDPADVPGLDLSDSARLVVPPFLESELYAELASPR